MKRSKIENIINLIILVVCLLLGSSILVWTTSIQADFLTQMGVNKWGALTIEPLLIITSFLLGIKITKTHKVIAFLFISILFGVSLLIMTSMYTKKSYVVLEQQNINQNLAKRSTNSEELISKTLEDLNKRGTTSSKSITKVIDQLQKQQSKTEKRVESDTLELKAIIETLTSLLHIPEKEAILIFSLFISLAAVFSPSFLFFSAGMMIRSLGVFDIVKDQIKRMEGLSLKQRIIMLAYENITTDIEELAKFLGTTERVIKSQLSRINKKGLNIDDKVEEIESNPKKKRDNK